MSETDKLAQMIRHGLYIFAALVIIESVFSIPHWIVKTDDTDAQHERSGMRLLIDHGTGCQYLQKGGITPRLDETGKHICEEKDNG